MDPKEERWFVRTENHTLGPFATAEVAIRLASGEILASDRICSDSDHSWQPLLEHPAFRGRGLGKPGADSLHLPPSPHLLWTKKRSASSRARAPIRGELPYTEILARVALPVLIPTPMLEPAQAAENRKPPPPRAPRTKKNLPPSVKAAPPTAVAPEQAPLPARSLAHALQEWNQEEPRKRTTGPVYEIAENACLLPTTPAPAIPSFDHPVRPSPPTTAPRSERVIRIELQLPRLDSRNRVIWGIAALLVALVGLYAYQNKTRDLKDSRLPDPSSPTTTLTTTGDPIPPLQAPTRPQRD